MGKDVVEVVDQLNVDGFFVNTKQLPKASQVGGRGSTNDPWTKMKIFVFTRQTKLPLYLATKP